jgi:hypothetical protein
MIIVPLSSFNRLAAEAGDPGNVLRFKPVSLTSIYNYVSINGTSMYNYHMYVLKKLKNTSMKTIGNRDHLYHESCMSL